MSTDSNTIHLLVYSGLALNGEMAILVQTSSFERLEKYMRWIAETQGLSGSLLGIKNVVSEEILKKKYHICHETLDQLMPNAQWEATSLWSIVNRDFSRITNDRLEDLLKRLNLPKLELSFDQQRELMDRYDPLRYSLGQHSQSKELVPVMCTKMVGGKLIGASPNGKSIPIDWIKQVKPESK